MALTNSQAVAEFINPITVYKNIGRIQKALLKYAVPGGNDSLSAMRVLSVMFDTNVGTLMHKAIEPVLMENLTDAEVDALEPLNSLFNNMKPFENVLRSAVNEGAKFLPPPTVEILREYNTEGSPIDRIAVGAFMVMATNLQDYYV